LRSNFDRASLLTPKAFFCYFFAALGKKVEDIALRLALQLFFWQDQTHQVRKIGSTKTLWMFSADPNLNR
jgi:hypothetical protein